ncbi:MAG: hypothetical protein EXS05_18685 [Planctomycetaceae bacterium]|nr:hypothetical protein [Planctomycetaceae bacterium]
MFRRFGSAVLIAWLLIAARPLAAAENAYDAISNEAGVVVRIKNPEATVGKIADLVDLVVPGVGMQIRSQFEGIGLAISNPTMAGVDKQADWWLAVYPRPGDEEPEVVFVIPATDLKAMKEGLGANMKFMEYGKFGVYTDDADAAERTAARIKGAGKSIESVVDADSIALFSKGDLSVFIHVTRLLSVYKNQLTEARERLTQVLENVPSEAPGLPGMNLKTLAEAMTQGLDVLLQGLNDTQSCTIAAMVSKEGLAIEDLVRFAANSKTDALLQKSPPNTLTGLGALPAGGKAYMGLHGDLAGLSQFGMKMSGALLGGNEQAAKDFQAAMAAMQNVKFGDVAASFGIETGESGAIRSVSVSEVAEPSKIRQLTQKMMKSLGTIQTGAIKQTYELKPDAEKQGANSVDLLKIKIEADNQGAQESEMMVRFMNMMYGPEGMVTRTVYLKDKIVQTSGGGKDALTQALTTLEKKTETAGATTPFKSARGQLAAKANLVVLFDLPGALAKLLELVADEGIIPPVVPISAEMFRTLDLAPSFLGLSMATEPQGLRVFTNIPTEQAQGVAKIVMKIMAAVRGGGLEN